MFNKTKIENQPRKIIHLDMDSFYASVEMRDDPSLAVKPLAVGGDPARRGVVCTANYIARKYGVRSGMATAYALRLCPNLVVLPVDMPKYRAVSEGIAKLFYNYTNLVEPLALDEAYLDVTGSALHSGSATWMAQALRQDIKQQFSLTASAGVASNKFLAKIASEWRKPDGLFVITPSMIEQFMPSLAVEKIHGVGTVTARKLHALNINTCGDLQQYSVEVLTENFGKFGKRLHELSFGFDERAVETMRERKSVSVETTFSRDVAEPAQCQQPIANLLEKLLKRLEKYQQRIIKKFVVKIKFFDFSVTTIERAGSLQALNSESFYTLFLQAYERKKTPLRLIGLGVHFE